MSVQHPVRVPDDADPSALVNDLMRLVPQLTDRVTEAFAPLLTVRDQLRGELLAAGEILTLPDPEPVRSLVAIDGARVREQMYTADLLVAVAATADGKSGVEHHPSDHAAWGEVIRHMDGSERLSETAMHALEMVLAARAPHHVRLLDGSLITPVIALRQALYTSSPEIRNAAAAMILGEWGAPDALRHLLTPNPDRPVLAVTKSDSADKYAKAYADRFDLSLPVGDRVLASHVLEPGELLAPRVLTELQRSYQETTAPNESAAKAVHQAAEAVRDAVAGAATANLARTTYFKPLGARTVMRVEYVRAADEPQSEGEMAGRYAAMVNAETAAPHMLEPFALWAVDRVAKNVSAGTTALRAALLRNLPAEHAEAYGAFLAQDYRTRR